MPRSDLDDLRAAKQQLIWCEWRATQGGKLEQPATRALAQEIQAYKRRVAVLQKNNTQKTPVKTPD